MKIFFSVEIGQDMIRQGMPSHDSKHKSYLSDPYIYLFLQIYGVLPWFSYNVL